MATRLLEAAFAVCLVFTTEIVDARAAASSGKGKVSWGVEPNVRVSSVGPEAVLPAFKFQEWTGPRVGTPPTTPATAAPCNPGILLYMYALGRQSRGPGR